MKLKFKRKNCEIFLVKFPNEFKKKNLNKKFMIHSNKDYNKLRINLTKLNPYLQIKTYINLLRWLIVFGNLKIN